jgi:hypothetical protein
MLGELVVLLVALAILAFVALCAYAKGRFDEARSRMTKMEVHYLDEQTKHDLQQW